MCRSAPFRLLEVPRKALSVHKMARCEDGDSELLNQRRFRSRETRRERNDDRPAPGVGLRYEEGRMGRMVIRGLRRDKTLRAAVGRERRQDLNMKMRHAWILEVRREAVHHLSGMQRSTYTPPSRTLKAKKDNRVEHSEHV
jgi:hypothetical protein